MRHPVRSGCPDLLSLRERLRQVIEAEEAQPMLTALTDETRGMFNKDQIAKMKKGAYLLNTGRAKCVIEADAVAALESGQLAGFGTDVWYSDRRW